VAQSLLVWVSKPGRKRGASTVAEERPEKAKKSKAAAAPNQSEVSALIIDTP
jgi:hypothetical protein